MALPGFRDPAQDVIKADTLGTTTLTGLGASVTAIGGVVVALLPTFTSLELSDAVTAACLGVVGLAALAWGIATAGDALARAYATAHVEAGTGVPALPVALREVAKSYENATFGIAGELKDDSDTKVPALAAAIERLAEAHENATFGIPGKLKDDSDTRKPALAEAVKSIAGIPARDRIDGEQIVEAPRGLDLSVNGHRYRVVALHFSPATSSVRQFYFDEAGAPHLTQAVKYGPANGIAD